MKYANSPEILKVVEKLADCKEERHQLFIQLEAIKAELASVKNTNQNLDGENRHLKEINKGLILKTVKKSNLEKISERK
jgi:regulator of replication initiation timing